MMLKHIHLPRSIASFALILSMTFACFATNCMAQQTDTDAAASAETTSEEWAKQSPEGSNAEFRMPAEPRELERSFKPVADRPQIAVKINLCSMYGGEIVFVFSYHDLHDLPESRSKVKEILDGAVKGSVARVIGQLNDDENVSLREYPGRKISYEFTQNGQPLISDSEIFLIGKRLYVLNTIFKDSNYDPKLSQKFFESFNPFNPEETLAMEETLDAQPLDSDASFGTPGGQMPVELK